MPTSLIMQTTGHSTEKMFLNFWGISHDDPRSNRDGIYFKQTKEIEGVTVEMSP